MIVGRNWLENNWGLIRVKNKDLGDKLWLPPLMISKEVRGSGLGQIVKDVLILCLTTPILGLEL
jgi:hypothetical protein